MAAPKKPAIKRRMSMKMSAPKPEGGLKYRPQPAASPGFQTPQATTGRGVKPLAKAAPAKPRTAAQKYGTTGFAGKGDKVGPKEEKRSMAAWKAEQAKPNTRFSRDKTVGATPRFSGTSEPRVKISSSGKVTAPRTNSKGGSRTRKAL